MEKKGKPPLVEGAAPRPAPETAPAADSPLTGEQIYRRLLKSTVWIVAPQNNGPPPPGAGGMPAQWRVLKEFQDQLTARDPFNPYRPGTHARRYSMMLYLNKTYRIDLISNAFDTYLILEDPQGQVVAEDDDSGGNLNACILFTCPRTGIYRIVCTSFAAGAGGPFLLRVQESVGPPLGRGPFGTPPLPPLPLPAPGIVSFGSGSLTDAEQRLIITANHVVGRAQQVRVYFPEYDAQGQLIANVKEYIRRLGLVGQVVARREQADLALVQLERLPAGVQPLPLAPESPRPGQEVHAVGNPGVSGALWVYSPGKVRQVFHDRWSIPGSLNGSGLISYDARKVETSSPVNPGDSGGPLVDDRARLVGVAHAIARNAQNFSTFIDVSEVRALLDNYLGRSR